MSDEKWVDRRSFLLHSIPELFRSGAKLFTPFHFAERERDSDQLRVVCPPNQCSIPLIVQQDIFDELPTEPYMKLAWLSPLESKKAANNPLAWFKEQSPIFFCSLSESLVWRQHGTEIVLVGVIGSFLDQTGGPTACCTFRTWLDKNHFILLRFLETYSAAAQWCNQNPAPAAQIASPILDKTIRELEDLILKLPIFLTNPKEALSEIIDFAGKLETANPGISGFIREDESYFYCGNS